LPDSAVVINTGLVCPADHGWNGSRTARLAAHQFSGLHSRLFRHMLLPPHLQQQVSLQDWQARQQQSQPTQGLLLQGVWVLLQRRMLQQQQHLLLVLTTQLLPLAQQQLRHHRQARHLQQPAAVQANSQATRSGVLLHSALPHRQQRVAPGGVMQPPVPAAAQQQQQQEELPRIQQQQQLMASLGFGLGAVLQWLLLVLCGRCPSGTQ